MPKIFGNFIKSVVWSIDGESSSLERNHLMEKCGTTLCWYELADMLILINENILFESRIALANFPVLTFAFVPSFLYYFYC